MPELLNTAWLIIAGIVSGIVWLIRLEGKIKYNEQTLMELKVKHEALDSKIVDKLSLIEKTIARIEGLLSRDNNNNN